MTINIATTTIAIIAPVDIFWNCKNMKCRYLNALNTPPTKSSGALAVSLTAITTHITAVSIISPSIINMMPPVPI